jgi:hypothetical protein
MHSQDTAPSRKDLRKFGLIMAGMIILFFGILLPWLGPLPRSGWTWVVAGVFAVVGLVAPAALGPVYRLWMKLGHVMGWINSRIILGIVFYAFILPMGLAMRLFGKDPMARRLDLGKTSYRVPSKCAPRDQLERPF